MFCQSCGQKLDDAAVFCTRCGATLVARTNNVNPIPQAARPAVAAQPAPVQFAQASGTASVPPNQAEYTRPCPFCSEMIAATAIKCRFCGSMLYASAPTPVPVVQPEKRIAASNPPKDPVLMALLSGCCIAGLGQIILGQTLKGVIILVASMLLAATTMGFSVLVTWPLGGVDAYLIAKKLKEGNTVAEWEFF